jgi:hypothetical protein
MPRKSELDYTVALECIVLLEFNSMQTVQTNKHCYVITTGWREKPARTMYVPERYTFHTFSDAAANDRVVTLRVVVICCKVLEATANIMVNFLISFCVVVVLLFGL